MFRGAAFQSAFSVIVALDLIDDGPTAGVLQVEGAEDVVDYEVFISGGDRVRIGQAKTRREPYSWGPAEVAALVIRWAELENAGAADFEFVTDGQLSSAANSLFRGGLEKDGREAELRRLGLDQHLEALQRVRLRTRQADAATLLELAVARARRTLETVRPTSEQEAEDAIARLFKTLVVAAGDEDPLSRTFTREQLAACIGLAPEGLDATRKWDLAVAAEYRAAVVRDGQVVHELPLSRLADTSSALTLTIRRADRSMVEDHDPLPLERLLEASRRCCLVGVTGAGKSTALASLAAHAAIQGQLPVVVSAQTAAGDLPRLVLASVEQRLGQRLPPGTSHKILADNDAVLLMDGLSELPPLRMEQLTSEIRELATSYPRLRCVVSGRDLSRLRGLGFDAYQLLPLNWEARRVIARAVIDTEDVDIDVDLLTGRIEKALGATVDNPLLFLMALSLWQAGVTPDTRTKLYDGYLAGVAERAGVSPDWDAARLTLGAACVALLREERFNADHFWWLATIERRLAELDSRGLVSTGPLSAADVLDRLSSIGLLVRDPVTGQIGLLHDSFRDHLAAKWLMIAEAEIPHTFGQSWEDVAAALAELGQRSEQFYDAVSRNPVAAARAATSDVSDATAWTPTIATALFHNLTGTQNLSLQVASSEQELAVFVIDGESGWISADQRQLALSEAVAVATTAAGSGPLAVAVLAWMTLLRRSLREFRAGTPSRTPTDQTALAGALERAFEARRSCLNDVVSTLGHELGERVLREIAWNGLRGFVLPPRREHWGEVSHEFYWSTSVDEVNVIATDSAPRSDEWDERGTAENWLREPPGAVVRTKVRKLLASLLPEYGP
jgi:hypothetical protein